MHAYAGKKEEGAKKQEKKVGSSGSSSLTDARLAALEREFAGIIGGEWDVGGSTLETVRASMEDPAVVVVVAFVGFVARGLLTQVDRGGEFGPREGNRKGYLLIRRKGGVCR